MGCCLWGCTESDTTEATYHWAALLSTAQAPLASKDGLVTSVSAGPQRWPGWPERMSVEWYGICFARSLGLAAPHCLASPWASRVGRAKIGRAHV